MSLTPQHTTDGPIELEIFSSALELFDSMARWSRTKDAGRLRQLAVLHVVCGEPSVDVIAKRLKVTRRRVFQCLREVRGHCPNFTG
jgi:hypothetical protein